MGSEVGRKNRERRVRCKKGKDKVNFFLQSGQDGKIREMKANTDEKSADG